MSPALLRLLIAGALLLHGLGHGGALAALLYISKRPNAPTAGWLAAQSWLLPNVSQGAATVVASAFWFASMLGFVVVAMSFWGVAFPSAWWRPGAIVFAIVSSVGIAVFFGTWPMFNTVAALAMNAAVLVALLAVGWPPRALFGR